MQLRGHRGCWKCRRAAAGCARPLNESTSELGKTSAPLCRAKRANEGENLLGQITECHSRLLLVSVPRHRPADRSRSYSIVREVARRRGGMRKASRASYSHGERGDGVFVAESGDLDGRREREGQVTRSSAGRFSSLVTRSLCSSTRLPSLALQRTSTLGLASLRPPVLLRSSLSDSSNAQ